MTEGRIPTFSPNPNTHGNPMPKCDDITALSDLELADYIAASGYFFDGLTTPAREAIVRLLRRPTDMAKERLDAEH